MPELYQETVLRFDNARDWALFVRLLGNKLCPRAVFLGDLSAAVKAAYSYKAKTECDGSVTVEMGFHRDAEHDLSYAIEQFRSIVAKNA